MLLPYQPHASRRYFCWTLYLAKRPDGVWPQMPSHEVYASSQQDTKALTLEALLLGKSFWESFSSNLSGKPPRVSQLCWGQLPWA